MASRTDPASATEPGVTIPVKRELLYLLVVDDNPVEAGRLRDVLMENGCACDVVVGAADLARAFRARDYDLIFVSLRSTAEPVIHALHNLREFERHVPEPHVPLFIVSRGILLEEREQLIAAGADDVIRRTDDDSALQDILERTVRLDRRTPPELIPREPMHYPFVLARCGDDPQMAEDEIQNFSVLVKESIRDLKTALDANDPPLARRAAEQLRIAAMDLKCGRVQRTAYLATKLDRIPSDQFQDRGRELLADLQNESDDLAIWAELKLGRVTVGRLNSDGVSGRGSLALSEAFRKRLAVFQADSTGG